jgi:ATP-dependent helicase Lhr and Lhr-like helicase
VDTLRAVRKQERTGETVTLSAADPLNMVGILLPGSRVPALMTNAVAYVDGIPEDATPAFA